MQKRIFGKVLLFGALLIGLEGCLNREPPCVGDVEPKIAIYFVDSLHQYPDYSYYSQLKFTIDSVYAIRNGVDENAIPNYAQALPVDMNSDHIEYVYVRSIFHDTIKIDYTREMAYLEDCGWVMELNNVQVNSTFGIGLHEIHQNFYVEYDFRNYQQYSVFIDID